MGTQWPHAGEKWVESTYRAYTLRRFPDGAYRHLRRQTKCVPDFTVHQMVQLDLACRVFAQRGRDNSIAGRH